MRRIASLKGYQFHNTYNIFKFPTWKTEYINLNANNGVGKDLEKLLQTFDIFNK